MATAAGDLVAIGVTAGSAWLRTKNQIGLEQDSPLTWASWHLRSGSILKRLCYGNFRIRLNYVGMEANLLGKPHPQAEAPA
jgi:hypothetical protein